MFGIPIPRDDRPPQPPVTLPEEAGSKPDYHPFFGWLDTCQVCQGAVAQAQHVDGFVASFRVALTGDPEPDMNHWLAGLANLTPAYIHKVLGSWAGHGEYVVTIHAHTPPPSTESALLGVLAGIPNLVTDLSRAATPVEHLEHLERRNGHAH